VQQVCNGDLDRPILLEVRDWDASGTHGMIGRCQTSLRAIVEPAGGRQAVRFTLVNDELRKKKGAAYKGSGVLEFTRSDILKQHTLLEFVRGGCELALQVAIDFTASNGAPSLASSLHYRNPMGDNEYQQAIRAVGEILLEYDSDKQVPVWGFGGQINGRVEHCFPLTFDPEHDEVDGVQGLLAAYANAFQFVSLSGPTIFSKILERAAMCAHRAGCSQQQQQYDILLILTDGVINDMDATISQIVNASALPLSIIIVGVGNANFASMETLDADDERLRDINTGRVQQRDTVQFVPFRQYRGSPAALARDVLAEIPQQLVGYMKARGIVPNRPVAASNRHLQIPQARPAAAQRWGQVQTAVQQGSIPVAMAVAPPNGPRPPATAPPAAHAL
jgi:hypothetical protein